MLDLIVFDEEWKALHTVPLDIVQHDEMLKVAKAKDLGLTLRLQDYYEDAEFAVGELQALGEELRALCEAMADHPERPAVERIREAVRVAMREGRPLMAVAD